MKLSLGVAVGVSRFLSADKMNFFNDIIDKELNAVEIGLLNCSIGVMRKIPGVVPYPTEMQVKSIKEILLPKKFHLSVHGPYRISATSLDEKMLKFSKANLSATLKVANWLEAHHVTFHGGSFKKKHNNDHVKRVLMEWEEWRQIKGYNAKLAPEVGGKYNSFADFFTLVDVASSIDNCLITWDISHDFARGGNVTTEEGILKRLELLDQSFQLNEENRLPIHFSGIEVGKSGEQYHTLLDHGTGVPWQLVFSVLREQDFLKKTNLICESKVPKGEKGLIGNALTDALRLRDFLESGQTIKQYKGRPGHLDYYFSNNK